MNVACRGCCPLHVGMQARIGQGEERQRGGDTLIGKNGGKKGENRTLGRRGGDVCRTVRRAAQKLRTDARARSRAGELVVGTFNIRTLAFKGTSGIGHTEVILKTCKDAGCDVVGLQEVGRDGQSAFAAAGCVVFCSGADGG